ncbi:MAG TPA: universal stress protein UspA [Coxiellaceae bacterium]|nr:MAG: universal stress protein UspA [Gammaproteobacteria bacterium RBG_16_37_9]HBC71896.1 universal stress protein UspA [Coxiellaceae bacterium]HBS51983.1 universal stress protein UspA [Coxiellaceae bacterium]
MKGYKNILVAVELNSKTDAEPLKHAEFFAKEFGADVVLVHAVEHIGSYGAYGIGVGFEIEEILIENSNKEMKKLGETIGIPEDKRIVKTGPAKFVILEEADKINADLIIVGSHGRHGIRVILGSTANAVLHGAKCDVLAVRLKE